ncbi:hypothetical protein Agub_g14919 [Astrephomene gubernaculifera]|uniref:AB hydrolase-1 domain-containing protein n=1 Tax=Astrephomene gubernaculifera TaxID=47775 RepID=A0AAD3E278_9CHLO|nr:hypothetical protein Agub_g14919 [Astrephomene gubernaculifera]
MGVPSRLAVLDTGLEARKHCKLSGTVALTTGITLAYQVYELKPQQHELSMQIGAGVEAPSSSTEEPKDRVIMIMGFACTGSAWLPLLQNLFSREQGDSKEASGPPTSAAAAGLEIAVYDNRGIGCSSCPTQKSSYSTDIMAQDALGLMDYLGWRRAHVVGHSMGAMIAARLAVAAPERVASLTLISTTGGGSEAIPLNLRALRAAWRGLLASSADPHTRASVDLTFHFAPQLLATQDPHSGRRVKDVLKEQYVLGGKEHGPQPPHGQEGHASAVLKHGVNRRECRTLATAGFPIKLIHGSEDIVAAPRHAARLAARLGAPLVLLPGGAHFIPRDCAAEIVDELLATVEAVRQGFTHAPVVHRTAAAGSSLDDAVSYGEVRQPRFGASWCCMCCSA